MNSGTCIIACVRKYEQGEIIMLYAVIKEGVGRYNVFVVFDNYNTAKKIAIKICRKEDGYHDIIVLEFCLNVKVDDGREILRVEKINVKVDDGREILRVEKINGERVYEEFLKGEQS